MKVKLDDVLEALEFSDGETEYYYHKKTERIVFYMDEVLTGEDLSELKKDIDENFEDYISLPTQYEIDEYAMMEKFIWSLPAGSLQDRLEYAIQGRGAFRRFKDLVYELDLEDGWFNFRDAEYVALAKEWCRDNGIEWEE